MSYKFERKNSYGKSNIDYRSQKDFKNIELYYPWKIKTAIKYGTMGLSDNFLIKDIKDKTFSPIKQIATQKELVQELPNPRYYESAYFYSKKKIIPKQKTYYENEKLGELEESFKGKGRFTGDSMMISDLTNQIKNRAVKYSDASERAQKESQKKNLIIEKRVKNLNATHETQLVKIEAKPTLEDKVNIQKLQEIRFALRRRYGSRGNLRKIFNPLIRESYLYKIPMQ